MASPLNGRLKRLEEGASVGETRPYILVPEVLTSADEWIALCRDSVDRDIVEELEPLKPGKFARTYCTRVRSGPLQTAIAEERKAFAGKIQPLFWVCSDHTEGGALINELAQASSRSHALVFTDLEDEMRLGPGRHRID